ncbi:MAG TPA: preprotein translocase subunit SecG [Acidimicrobiales bacterium]|nr:preprotein translocase subunit SecG [Acidimicrobiales bacterium]
MAPLAAVSPLTLLVIIVHVAVSFALVLLILLHSGRGSGLSDMFGGGMGASAAGSTVMERNLDRLTVMVAIVFAFTSTVLVIRLQ